MQNETLEKILIIDGKVQADILVEHLKEHDIPACSQTEAPGARGNNAPPGEGIYVSRSDARAARKLLEDFFRTESSGEEDPFQNTSRLTGCAGVSSPLPPWSFWQPSSSIPFMATWRSCFEFFIGTF